MPARTFLRRGRSRHGLLVGFGALVAVVGSAVRGIGKQHRSRRPWALVTSLDVRLLVDVACVSQRGPPVSSVRA